MQNTNETRGQGANPFPKMEEEVLKFWNDNKIFEKSVEREAPKGDYVFYDGPPFATGMPHYGHIVASVMKDVVPRYWTMKGHRVERRWGWDCHGLPIENIVEKEFGSKSKKDIEAIGVDKFNEMCRSKVSQYVEDWKVIINRLGRWADMENSYKTMDLDFMESVWFVFKELWDKGLIYEGYRSMYVCPRCETTLSQSEISEGYRMVKDLSATVKFELKDEPGTFVLAWTTTPWTLIGNVALAIGEDIDYVQVKIVGDENKYILAKDRAEEVLKGKEFEIEKEFRGGELVGKKYKPVFDYYAKNEKLENRENGWKIYAGSFVTTEDGVGVVHIAPAFGEDDMNLGKLHNLPFIQHVGMDGNIREEAGEFAGKNVKPAEDRMLTDIDIIKYLAHNGFLFHKEKYEHSYPHCWRCDTPLINYATSSWFVNVSKIKLRALELAQNINWSPEHIKEGRFGNWLEGARDWSISRQRFWASVMPIWRCKCGEIKVFGSVADLEKASGEKITDIHKHIVDKITFPCEKCEGEMKRVPDVLDTWFDSGSMPYAQMHYPFENKEKFENNFPAEFIAEGVDQTRCWFYYLHIIGTAIRDSHAFKNVIVNGIVLAEDGKKMSKRLNNYPDPALMFDKYGADAIRFYLTSSPVMAADNLNFSEEGVKEALRKNVMILWNVYKFYELFKDTVTHAPLHSDGHAFNNVLDQWIMARLNELVRDVTKFMDSYDLPRATRPITEFIDDLSTWYLRRSRDRFKSEDEDDKKAALFTTHCVLIQLAKVMAPFMPFVAENLWQKVTGNDFSDTSKSVHLEVWPKEFKAHEETLTKMQTARRIVELGLAKRDEAGIKVRQPLAKLTVNNLQLAISDEYLDLIKDEVNVKEIEVAKGEGNLSVELDTEITEELKLEGVKRELVRFINNMRKDADMSIGDRALVGFETGSDLIKRTIELFGSEIMKDTLTERIEEGINAIEFKKEVRVDGEVVVLGVVKI